MLKSNYGKIGTLASIAVAAVILCIVFIFIFFLGANTKRENEIIVSNEAFEIKGMYGNTLKIADITSIELKDVIPEIGKKTNGAGLGEIRKGYFEVSGLGECLLFIHSDKEPYIYINTKFVKIIMNFRDGEKTKKIYNFLIDKWNQ